MKRIALSCLLGIGLLLPSISAKSNFSSTSKKIIDAHMEGYVLLANSDTKSGTLMRVEVYDVDMQCVLVKQCSGYTAQVDLSMLPPGDYEADIIATKDKKWYPVVL